MKQTFYEIINIWIESRKDGLKVIDLTDTDIAELKRELIKNDIMSSGA